MKHHISLIGRDLLVPEVIDRAIELLRPAIELTNRYTPGSIYGDIASGRHQLWLIMREATDAEKVETQQGFVFDAALTTCLEEYPAKKMLRLCFCGGEALDAWSPEMHQAFVDFAKANECDGIEIVGRQGWPRHLKNHGYEVTGMTCEIFFPEEKSDEMAA